MLLLLSSCVDRVTGGGSNASPGYPIFMVFSASTPSTKSMVPILVITPHRFACVACRVLSPFCTQARHASWYLCRSRVHGCLAGKCCDLQREAMHRGYLASLSQGMQ